MSKVWGWKCDALHEVGMGKVEERGIWRRGHKRQEGYRGKACEESYGGQSTNPEVEN